jgi:hypothetical protein
VNTKGPTGLTATKVGGRKKMVTIVKTKRYLLRTLVFCASTTDCAEKSYGMSDTGC